MKKVRVKILTCVMVYILTFTALLICGVSTTHARAPQEGDWTSVPAGTRILIRLSETLTSANQRAGARFTGRLETNLMAEGMVAAPRGTTVHGQVVSAQSGGKMAGGSQLALELTDIVINDTAHPILTSSYELQGQGQGGQTARTVVAGAGLGSVIGAIAGRGRGAAIGAAAGGGLGTASAAGGGGAQQVSFAEGTMLEFRLQQPASLPRPVNESKS